MKIILFLFCSISIFANALYFPTINSFSNNDPIYSQLVTSIKEYNKSVYSTAVETPNLKIFKYHNDGSLNFYSLVSKLQTISKDSIITLNRLESIKAFSEKDEILIPSVPGVFVFEETASSLEDALLKRLGSKLQEAQMIMLDEDTVVYFFKGQKLTSSEFFALQKPVFITPVDGRYYVSSVFGKRSSPIDHKSRFHAGVDLASPEGTNVVSMMNGKVIKVGREAVLGNYILIKHGFDYESVYAHLETGSIIVKAGDDIKSGQKIAKVGSTGWATGPHLHFEIHYKGKPINPIVFLKRSIK